MPTSFSWKFLQTAFCNLSWMVFVHNNFYRFMYTHTTSHNALLDFEKVFVRNERQQLWEILEWRGLQWKLIRAVSSLYCIKKVVSCLLRLIYFAARRWKLFSNKWLFLNRLKLLKITLHIDDVPLTTANRIWASKSSLLAEWNMPST